MAAVVSNPGPLAPESDTLPLSLRAPHLFSDIFIFETIRSIMAKSNYKCAMCKH